jgi:hypothetical protein
MNRSKLTVHVIDKKIVQMTVQMCNADATQFDESANVRRHTMLDETPTISLNGTQSAR